MAACSGKNGMNLIALGLSLSNILEMQTSTPRGRFFLLKHAAAGYRYLKLTVLDSGLQTGVRKPRRILDGLNVFRAKHAKRLVVIS